MAQTQYTKIRKPKLTDILAIANKYKYPIFKSQGKYNYNVNIWGFRANDKDTSKFNDLCVVFYETRWKMWNFEYFDVTTDPSDLNLMDPINIDGTAILCEGHHKGLWTLGFHKQRRDHEALIQHNPCRVYRDNSKDNIIDSNLPIQEGMFGINMHRASAYGTNPKIGLYSAGCQVHANKDRYDSVFIPLMKRCHSEGNTTFSYTLCKESDLLT